MAVVDNVNKFPQTNPSLEMVRAQLTGASSTFETKFATIQSVLVQEEDANGATYTWTGRTITITGTDDDWVTIIIAGKD